MTPIHPPHRGHAHRRGSAMVMAIIVSVVLTALVITLSWAAGVQAEMTSNLTKIDQAFYAAETGTQRVAWYLKNGKLGSISSPLTGQVGSYRYSTSWTTTTGNTIRITSTGSLGSVAYTCYQTVTPPQGLPVVASGSSFDNKNVVLKGSVSTGGDYSNGGSGSLSGNLTYAGTATGTDHVGGTVTQAPFVPLDISAILTTLQAAAGKTYSGDQTGTVFDFTMISGANKVIYVNGNVSNPTFIGTGTLAVNGAISVGSAGTPPFPVNLVASGNIVTSNNISFFGTIYTAGNWDRGKINMTGLAYAATMTVSDTGHSSIRQTAAPWFDPRAGSSGTGLGSMTMSDFGDPIP